MASRPKVIGREQLAIADRRSLGLREIGCLVGSLERTDKLLGEAVGDRIGIADRHARSALVEVRDAQPDELQQAVGEQPVGP